MLAGLFRNERRHVVDQDRVEGAMSRARTSVIPSTALRAATIELDADRGTQALKDLVDFPLIRYPHDLFLLRVWELRHNVTAYDAAYIALAEALGALLLTRDAALASAHGNRARIDLI